MTAQHKAQAERLPRGTLDRATVVSAALDIADHEGIGAVTLARVASELGASTMSLYRHVRDKQDLLEAIVELALADVPALAQDSRSWRLRLEEFAVASRQAALRHPAMIEIGLSQDLYGPVAIAVGLGTIALLRDAGFDEDAAIRGFMALRNHVIGAMSWEISRFRRGAGEFHRHEVESFVRRDTPADSPLWHFGQVVADDPEAQFQFGVNRLLDGLEAELRRSKRGARPSGRRRSAARQTPPTAAGDSPRRRTRQGE